MKASGKTITFAPAAAASSINRTALSTQASLWKGRDPACATATRTRVSFTTELISCSSSSLLYPSDSDRTVVTFEIQIERAEEAARDRYLRVIHVVHAAAAVGDLPDLAVGEPDACIRLPALEPAWNLTFDRGQPRRRGRFRFHPELLGRWRHIARARLSLSGLGFASRRRQRLITSQPGSGVDNSAAS